MSLKNASLLALVGMMLLTTLVLVHLVIDIWGVLNSVVPPIRLLASLIRALASLSVAVFFYVFHNAQG